MRASGADGDKDVALLEPMDRIGLGGGQDTGRLAGLVAFCQSLSQRRLDIRMAGLAEMTKVGRQIGRPEKYSVDAVNGGDFLNPVERRAGFDLHQDAEFALDPGRVLLDASVLVAALGE